MAGTTIHTAWITLEVRSPPDVTITSVPLRAPFTTCPPVTLVNLGGSKNVGTNAGVVWKSDDRTTDLRTWYDRTAASTSGSDTFTVVRLRKEAKASLLGARRVKSVASSKRAESTCVTRAVKFDSSGVELSAAWRVWAETAAAANAATVSEWNNMRAKVMTRFTCEG